jgi:hypothetical protein
MTDATQNPQLVLIGGLSGAGKSASLRNIRNQNRWLYFNAENGKRLPFRNEFQSYTITDPYQVYEGFDHATNNIPDQVDGVIVDTMTFLLDMFESLYIRGAVNTQKAWGDFADFTKVLFQQKVALFGKPVLILAHVLETLDEVAMEMKTAVPVKGSTKNQGIEAFFSTVVEARKLPIKELEDYRGENNILLNINEEEDLIGVKHVFQTRLTKSTVGKRIRSPMGMFTKEQTFIDNDAQLLLDHLKTFYGQ